MAIEFENKNGAKAAPEVEPTAAQQPQEEFSKTPGGMNEPQKSFSGAPSVGSTDVFTRFASMNSALSEKARLFLTTVQTNLEQMQVNATKPRKIEVVKMVYPKEAHVFICEGFAVPFIFEECVPPCGSCTFMAASQPTGDSRSNEPSHDIYTQLNRLRPDVKDIHSPVVIDREDYTRGVRFAQWLSRLFAVRLDGVTIYADMFKGKRIEIHDSAVEYDQAYEFLCPHATQLRADVKLTFWLVDANRQRNNQDNSELALYQAQSQDMCIGCVGLATDFIHKPFDGSGKDMYYPVTYITDDNPLIPTDACTYLFGARLKSLVLQNRLWAKPYTNLNDKDPHDHVRDIGNLFPDDNGAPFKTNDLGQLKQILDTSFEPVQIQFELNEGRALPYGADRRDTVDASTIAAIIHDISNLIGTEIPYSPNTDTPIVTREVKYRGFYEYGNKVLDTANIDTLTQIAKTGARGEEIRALELAKSGHPSQLMDAQRRLEPTVRYLYRTASQEIDPQLLTIVDNEISRIIGPSFFNQMRPQINVASYAEAAARWGKYSNSGFSSGASYWAYDNYRR